QRACNDRTSSSTINSRTTPSWRFSSARRTSAWTCVCGTHSGPSWRPLGAGAVSRTAGRGSFIVGRSPFAAARARPPTHGRRRSKEKRRPALPRLRAADGGAGRPPRILQPVSTYLTQQGAGADAQQVGGPLAVAPGLPQALLDRLALQIRQR